ncbi:hypothetical protein [Pandoraea sp. NPDC087047]|uniref:hypothetical protein n=1 Tax=Pandoraea sp. NPDC087047 TaxID=3364390 RepID=UPI003823F6FE
MHKKLEISLTVGIALIAVTNSVVSAELPPACAQLARAYDICTRDYLEFVALVEPASLPAIKQTFKEGDIGGMWRKAMRQVGAEKTAVACASSEVKGQFISSLSGLPVVMGFKGGDGRRCAQAISDIR